jgi:hypothetical protein
MASLSARDTGDRTRKSRSLFYPSGPITARHTKGREWLLPDEPGQSKPLAWCKSGAPTYESRISSVPSTRGEVLPALIIPDSSRLACKAMRSLRRDLNGLLDSSKDGSNGQLSAVAALLTPGEKPGGQKKALKPREPDDLSDDELWESIGKSSGAGKLHKYIKFTPLAMRSKDADAVQLGHIGFRSGGANVSVAGAVGTNPRGNNPTVGMPGNAIDGMTNTKWIDMNKGKLIITFANPVHADEFCFTTAIDDIDRDPVSWRLEGSMDYVSWTTLHEQTSYATPMARKTSTPWFPLSQVSRSDLKTTAIAKLNTRRSHDDAGSMVSAR